MKKKTFFLIWVILVLFLGTVFGEEPEGFRGIKWGTNKSKVDGLSCDDEDKQLFYTCTRKEEKKIGDIKVKAILYGFYKGQFAGAIISFKGFSNFVSLKGALTEKYGQGKRPNQFLEEYTWRFENVNIQMNYSEVKSGGSIFYHYVPIWGQEHYDRKEKERNAKEDVYRLEDVLRLIEVDFNWHTIGYGNVMVADFTVTNLSKYKIKDIEITCYHFGKSGTKIDSNTRTIYDIVPAKGKKYFKDVNMGFFHSQTNKSGCKCTNLKIVE